MSYYNVAQSQFLQLNSLKHHKDDSQVKHLIFSPLNPPDNQVYESTSFHFIKSRETQMKRRWKAKERSASDEELKEREANKNQWKPLFDKEWHKLSIKRNTLCRPFFFASSSAKEQSALVVETPLLGKTRQRRPGKEGKRRKSTETYRKKSESDDIKFLILTRWLFNVSCAFIGPACQQRREEKVQKITECCSI